MSGAVGDLRGAYGQLGNTAGDSLNDIIAALQMLAQKDPNGFRAVVSKIRQELSQYDRAGAAGLNTDASRVARQFAQAGGQE